jgi:curli production assembly/transport component CsgF
MTKLPVYLICVAVFALLLANANMAGGSELVYTPINPSFGGNPFNGPWLLDSAQAQNKFEEEYERDLMEDFEERLVRQLLYRLSRSVIDEAFGEYGEPFEPGHYEIGNYHIDITTDGLIITVVIVDIETGDTTTVEVPYYT